MTPSVNASAVSRMNGTAQRRSVGYSPGATKPHSCPPMTGAASTTPKNAEMEMLTVSGSITWNVCSVSPAGSGCLSQSSSSNRNPNMTPAASSQAPIAMKSRVRSSARWSISVTGSENQYSGLVLVVDRCRAARPVRVRCGVLAFDVVLDVFDAGPELTDRLADSFRHLRQPPGAEQQQDDHQDDQQLPHSYRSKSHVSSRLQTRAQKVLVPSALAL